MKSLYVLDALNYLFRSYHAIGPMTSPSGEATNALYGFIRSIFKVIKEFSPYHLVAVFDGSESTKSRKEIYSEYKANREKMPEDLYQQLQWAVEFCELAGIPHLATSGVEADDVMGSIAKWASGKQIDTFLCTSDKDMAQLVDDHVKIINIHKDRTLDRTGVKEVYGVFPEQIPDLLAMMGDTSDNIPGLPGIGPKTAATWLEEFGSLHEILNHTDQIKGKKQAVVREGKEQSLMSLKLATIQTDVPLPVEEDFFKLKHPELEKLRAFYQQMHFMSLLKELTPPEQKNDQLTFDLGSEKQAYTLINDAASFANLLTELRHAGELCIDTETSHLSPIESTLVGIGIAKESKRAYYVPLNGALAKETVINGLKPLLENPEVGVFGHNIKYDLHLLERYGIHVKNVSFDTMVASYILAPHKQRHGLDALTLELFGKVKTPISELIGKGKKQISMANVPLPQISEYCSEDVDYTFRLKERFEKEIKAENLTHVFEDIELPLIPILLKMERRGIYLDSKELAVMAIDLKAALEALTKEIYEETQQTFNLNSPKQLGEILFEKMGIKGGKKTKTGYSTSADVLERLTERSPVIPKILEYRKLEKLRSTYVDTLPEQIAPSTGRVHCSYNQSVAATGRLSCNDPNLQNIPIRTELGRKIRTAFKPEKAGWSFLSADYSQIELRLLAHLSGDPGLIKAFQEGEDIHAYTASLVYNIPLNEVTSQMRYSAKAVNFGIIYGQQAFGLSKEIGISFEEAKDFIDTYFERYPKVRDYLEHCKESVRQTGKSLTLTGRIRPIPEITSKNPFLRQMAERLAVNTPLQGTAADLIKLAMIEVDRKVPADLILQIHDELIFEVPDEQIKPLAQQVKTLMEGVMQLKVPLVVDISVGKNWGEC
ncbi:MAG: DNA polymerase I [Chlamydiae bacterium]|nr:DNA polymerase I [Chlamydiota bacterium]